MPTRAALYDFIPDPRDLAEHEEEFKLYRWGPEHDKYLAAQIVDAISRAAGTGAASLESRLLRFGDDHEEKRERLKRARIALKRAANSGSGWLTR